jgi:hypothetical protein
MSSFIQKSKASVKHQNLKSLFPHIDIKPISHHSFPEISIFPLPIALSFPQMSTFIQKVKASVNYQNLKSLFPQIDIKPLSHHFFQKYQSFHFLSPYRSFKCPASFKRAKPHLITKT